MAAGLTLYSDISARVNDIIEDSMAVARMTNVLMQTITPLGATGMMVRKVNEYNAVTFAAAGEDDDTGAQQLTKDPMSSLTPSIYRARIDITDARAASDFDSEIARASSELGAAAATHVDTSIATAFGSLTGGTVGAAGSVATWTHIVNGLALLMNQGVNRASPVYCALHPFVWAKLLAANSIAAATVAAAPGYQDQMAGAASFFRIPQFQGITFVISNTIAIDGSTDAKGAIYVPEAIAVDTRKAFDVRPQRDESRELTELNSSMWYASGTWRPQFGVTIYTDAATPS